jgi:hypothetical protein
MARIYTVQKRDTLVKIARRFYEDPGLSTKLANYNGILNPDLIQVGQRIEIPPWRELEGPPQAPPAPEPAAVPPALLPPDGLDQIMAVFGNIYDYLRDDGSLDPRWEADQLGRAQLPFGLPLSWDQSKLARTIYGHKRLTPVFTDVFAAIQREGLQGQLRTYGGCYNFRGKRTSGKLSTHSWGIAIDLNPETNAQGGAGNMHEGIVDIFRRFGFKWGGDWSGKTKDPMHFQFCTGY